jgi:hypothetical protein
MHTYTHTHVHTYIHTYILTFIHTYVFMYVRTVRMRYFEIIMKIGIVDVYKLFL